MRPAVEDVLLVAGIVCLVVFAASISAAAPWLVLGVAAVSLGIAYARHA